MTFFKKGSFMFVAFSLCILLCGCGTVETVAEVDPYVSLHDRNDT